MDACGTRQFPHPLQSPINKYPRSSVISRKSDDGDEDLGGYIEWDEMNVNAREMSEGISLNDTIFHCLYFVQFFFPFISPPHISSTRNGWQ